MCLYCVAVEHKAFQWLLSFCCCSLWHNKAFVIRCHVDTFINLCFTNSNDWFIRSNQMALFFCESLCQRSISSLRWRKQKKPKCLDKQILKPVHSSHRMRSGLGLRYQQSKAYTRIWWMHLLTCWCWCWWSNWCEEKRVKFGVTMQMSAPHKSGHQHFDRLLNEIQQSFWCAIALAESVWFGLKKEQQALVHWESTGALNNCRLKESEIF